MSTAPDASGPNPTSRPPARDAKQPPSPAPARHANPEPNRTAAASPAQDPPAQDPPANDPPVQDPPAEDPPAKDPPGKDPPAVELPGKDPPPKSPPSPAGRDPEQGAPRRGPDIPPDAEVDREPLPAGFFGSPEGDGGGPREPATGGRRGPEPEPAHGRSEARAGSQPTRDARSGRPERAERAAPRRANGKPVGAAALDLPDDAEDGLRETMAALQSLFPGHLLSIEQPNDGSTDGEPADTGLGHGVEGMPPDPDGVGPEPDDGDDGDLGMPRRAGLPSEPEA